VRASVAKLRSVYRASLALGALALALPAPVHAAAPDAADAGDGQTIVVTGEGLAESPAAPAYHTQTIAAAQLQATASGRIDDALLSAAGVQQYRRSDSRASNPSAQGITLRALGGNATSRTWCCSMACRWQTRSLAISR
jgi:outer membrane receptor protein involved in Fe transport